MSCGCSPATSCCTSVSAAEAGDHSLAPVRLHAIELAGELAHAAGPAVVAALPALRLPVIDAARADGGVAPAAAAASGRGTRLIVARRRRLARALQALLARAAAQVAAFDGSVGRTACALTLRIAEGAGGAAGAAAARGLGGRAATQVALAGGAREAADAAASDRPARGAGGAAAVEAAVAVRTAPVSARRGRRRRAAAALAADVGCGAAAGAAAELLPGGAGRGLAGPGRKAALAVGAAARPRAGVVLGTADALAGDGTIAGLCGLTAAAGGHADGGRAVGEARVAARTPAGVGAARAGMSVERGWAGALATFPVRERTAGHAGGAAVTVGAARRRPDTAIAGDFVPGALGRRQGTALARAFAATLRAAPRNTSLAAGDGARRAVHRAARRLATRVRGAGVAGVTAEAARAEQRRLERALLGLGGRRSLGHRGRGDGRRRDAATALDAGEDTAGAAGRALRTSERQRGEESRRGTSPGHLAHSIPRPRCGWGQRGSARLPAPSRRVASSAAKLY